MADEEKNDATPEEEATPEQPEAGAGQGTPDEEPGEGQAAEAEDAAPGDGGETDEPAPAEEAAPDEGAAVEEGDAEEAPAEEASAGGEEAPAEDAAAAEEAPAGDAPAEEPSADERRPEPARSAGAKKSGKKDDEPEVIPGAHLEPDLVLEEDRGEGVGDLAGAEIEAAEQALAADPPSATDADEPGEAGPVAREPLDLAADARYRATGKRKTAVARVILKPGDGTYTINGRALDQFFPRPTLQTLARSPLETAGYGSRMDVVAKIHGGGVSSQAGALRHGIARALVEADPNLRVELKRRGFLTRDARVKERKKAGLKKARKRPQFSKR